MPILDLLPQRSPPARDGRAFWAILAMMVIVPAVLVTAYLASFEAPPDDAEQGECPQAPAGVEAELDMGIEKRGRIEPQAKVSMLVDVPDGNGLAGDLLRLAHDDDKHKLALLCVLGEAGPAWLQQPPSITKQGDRVVVRTTATRAVAIYSGAHSEIGPLRVDVRDPEHWQAKIEPPELLSWVRWRVVSVTAPVGWLSGLETDLTTAETGRMSWERPPRDRYGTDVERIRWERPERDAASERLASFTVHPDVRTQIASTPQTWQWQWVASVLYGLSTLVLVGMLLLWAYQRRVTLVWRMCLPVLAVTLTVVAVSILASYVQFWPWAVMLASLLASAVIVLAAFAWGMPRLLTAAAGAEAALVIAVLIPFLWWLETDNADLVAVNNADLVGIAACALFTFHLTVLLVTGVINAARVLLSGAQASGTQTLRAPLWVWWTGGALATLLVVEQFVGVHRALVNPTTGSETVSAFEAIPAVALSPAMILHNVEPLLTVLAVIGAWALLRERIENRFIILFFVLGPVAWTAAPFGSPLPVWPLAWLVLWLWLGHSRPLLNMEIPPSGSTVRSVTEQHDLSILRAAAELWGRIRHRGRALDRDVAKGAISLDAHAQETKKLLDMSLLPDESVQTMNQLRAASVTPVDVVLALGPKSTPMENAKQGAKIAALVGTPAAALNLWVLWWRTSPPQWPAMGYSSLLDVIGKVAGAAAGWVATGAVLGLLWQRLPFRRGIGKALPLVTAFAAVELVRYASEELIGGNSTALVGIGLFTVVTTVTALFMDLGALSSSDTWWSRRRDALAAAYGMENLSTQVAFVATQAVAIFTIFAAVHGELFDQPADQRPPVVEQNQIGNR